MTQSVMEILLRANDQTDEQLHAGFYFYTLTSKGNFVSNTIFTSPLCMILAGFAILTLFDFYEQTDYTPVPLALLFMFLTYSLGIFFTQLPKIFMHFKGK